MATGAPRMTSQTQDVLAALLADPSMPLYGFQIADTTELSVGTVSPLLRRLVDAGWLQDFLEDAEIAEAEGRPRRRYYELTAEGQTRAHNALTAVEARRRRIASGARAAGAASQVGYSALLAWLALW